MNRPAIRTIALLVAACFAGAVAATILSPASASHQPADKVVAAGSKLEVVGPNEEVTLLTATLRTSSPTDLILSVSMECSIFTHLVTGDPNGDTSTATAAGTVRAWIEIDGQIVPINSESEDPATNQGTEADKVTFCNRVYSRTVTDNETTLLQPEGDGQDIEDDYIRTKDSNAFNWLRLNLGNGIHTIVVKGTLRQETAGDATAEAAIGSRTLIVEPTKLANDASV